MTFESRHHLIMSNYCRLANLNTINHSETERKKCFRVLFDDKKISEIESILCSVTDRAVVTNDLLQQLIRVKHVGVTVVPHLLRLELAERKSSIQTTKMAVIDLKFSFKTKIVSLRGKE